MGIPGSNRPGDHFVQALRFVLVSIGQISRADAHCDINTTIVDSAFQAISINATTYENPITRLSFNQHY